jgi:26S proteasome regulatory subunit T3
MELEEKPQIVQSDLKDEDLYHRIKALEKEIEFFSIQENYIKEEQLSLKRELIRSREEIKKIKSVPLLIGQFIEMIDENHGLVSSTTGSTYFVRILSTLDREQLKPSSSVALHRHSHSVVDILPPESDASIQMMQIQGIKLIL